MIERGARKERETTWKRVKTRETEARIHVPRKQTQIHGRPQWRLTFTIAKSSSMLAKSSSMHHAYSPMTNLWPPTQLRFSCSTALLSLSSKRICAEALPPAQSSFALGFVNDVSLVFRTWGNRRSNTRRILPLLRARVGCIEPGLIFCRWHPPPPQSHYSTLFTRMTPTTLCMTLTLIIWHISLLFWTGISMLACAVASSWLW